MLSPWWIPGGFSFLKTENNPPEVRTHRNPSKGKQGCSVRCIIKKIVFHHYEYNWNSFNLILAHFWFLVFTVSCSKRKLEHFLRKHERGCYKHISYLYVKGIQSWNTLHFQANQVLSFSLNFLDTFIVTTTKLSCTCDAKILRIFFTSTWSKIYSYRFYDQYTDNVDLNRKLN